MLHVPTALFISSIPVQLYSLNLIVSVYGHNLVNHIDSLSDDGVTNIDVHRDHSRSRDEYPDYYEII